MIFKYIEFSNFMLFHGEQRLEFFEPRNDPPETGLYLCLAANNAGKTSFIRALRFLFYGSESIGGGVQAGSVVCQKALAESQSHHSPKCYVEARVVHRDLEYTFRRELIYKRGTSITRAVVLNERAAYISHNPTKDDTISDPDRFAHRVREMVPEDLFNFFFFKGEELSGRLLEGDGDQSLQDSLMAIFQNSDWDLSESHLRDLQKAYHTKVVSAEKKNAAASGLVEERESLRAELKGYQTLLTSLRQTHVEKKAQFDDLESQILAAASSKHEQLKNEVISLKEQIKNLATTADEHRRNLFREIAHTGPVALISRAFAPVHAQLELLRQKKILPATVSEDFFSRLLSDKLCICERPLLEGSPERQEVEERRAACLSANLGQSLHQLSALVNPESAVGFPQTAQKGLTSIRREVEKLDEIRKKQLDVDEQLRVRKEKLDTLPETNLQALVHKKEKQKSDLREIEKQITTKELEESQTKQQLHEVDQQLIDMGVAGEANPHDVEAENVCAEFADLVAAMRDGLRDSFSSKLQKSVSHLYKDIVTDESVAVIDPETLLPSIKLHGQSGVGAGGAQSQALCLAYILSLAHLRREVAAELKELFYGNKTPSSGDQAFVMDSIFAPMQGNYVRETAEFLPGKAKQLIMLLSAKQFDEKVQRTWAPAKKGKSGPIDKAWRFLFHMPADKYAKTEPDERVATYCGKPVELLTPLTKNAHQFSQIQPL